MIFAFCRGRRCRPMLLRFGRANLLPFQVSSFVSTSVKNSNQACSSSIIASCSAVFSVSVGFCVAVICLVSVDEEGSVESARGRSSADSDSYRRKALASLSTEWYLIAPIWGQRSCKTSAMRSVAALLEAHEITGIPKLTAASTKVNERTV